MKQLIRLLTINQLALATEFSRTGLTWRFGTIDEARAHLRTYEKLIAQWGYDFGASQIVVVGGDISLPVTPRDSGLSVEASPIANIVNKDESNILIAQHWLNDQLIDVLIELKQNPGIAGLLNWQTQKQVVLTKSCQNIPIGEQLEDCLKFSREDYWLAPHLDEFKRKCRQSLRDDGSNTIEHRYLTFDPTTGGDWIEVVGRYRFVNAGKLGLFQLSQNISYAPIESDQVNSFM